MLCPLCLVAGTRVVDSRLVDPGHAVRRRRQCHECGHRFTTQERIEQAPLVVRKRDGRSEPYDHAKLLAGIRRAAAKRPVASTELDAVAAWVTAEVRSEGSRPESARIGELALERLAALDRVAAARFASVYRNVDDLGAFAAELQRLGEPPAQGLARPVPSGAPSKVIAPASRSPESDPDEPS